MTTNQEAMDGTSATWPLFNTMNDPGVKHGPFGEIKFQLGPVQDVGVNGTTIEDVLEVCIARIQGFQRGPFACRENALAITAMEEARNWLLQRTRTREAQGVEGVNAPHA